MGVTVHWVDSEVFMPCSAPLACRRFKGSHTFDKVSRMIQAIHQDVGLPIDKISATITDNGSNMVKAFKEFGIFNENENDDDDGLNFPEIEDFNGAAEIDAEVQLPFHVRCASHTLNLIATTDIAKIESRLFKQRHSSTMKKLNCLWNVLSMSPNKAKETANDCINAQLPKPCPTR